ncbi:MAG: tetratricopeptide repeat protein, partial [Chloroflexota bacterium]
EATVSEKIKTAESAAIWSALSELRYLFRHALLRDAAYGMQIQAHRQQLHQLAAHTIETLYKADLTPYYTDLALHFGQARQTVKAAHYAALAGKQAAYQFDNKTAVDYLTQALDLTPLNDVAKRLDLLLTREAVYGQQGAREKQAADLTELQTIAAQLENPEQKIDILRRETEFALFTSDYPRAIRAAQQAVALAQATDHLVLHTQTKISFGNVLMRQGEVTAAQEQLEQAYALAHQTQSSREQALCAQNLSYVYMRMGAFEKGKTYGLRAFELAQEIDNWGQVGFALTNVGTCCMHLGQIDEAEHYYTQSLEAKRKVGDRYGESGAVHNLGNAAYYQGKLDETATRFAQALKLKRAVGDREGEGMMYHNLGLLYQTLGFFEQSKAHYEKSLAISQELNASARLAATKQIFGLLLHYLGEQSTAQSYCEEALAHARQKDLRPHQANALNNLGYILAAQGHVDKARAALLEAIALRQESKQENLAIEAMAGLLPLPGNTEQDQQIWLETTLGFLETKGTNGMLEPSRVHLTCYQALAQQNDVRAAPLLQKAYAQLMEQANKLADPAAKHAFLNNVVANQAIVELHKNDTISA